MSEAISPLLINVMESFYSLIYCMDENLLRLNFIQNYIVLRNLNELFFKISWLVKV